ncbi:MAG: AMP phosphorylase [Nitrososphaerota archaeon]|nr:AMP phosphorylase [Candidatus Bathyarchaeota archaeon]MDW8062320.1 AMP phosphorylase [Nitrososphaerota archaeon]
MRFRVKPLSLEAGGKWIVILNEADAEELGVKSLSRVKVRFDNKVITAIVNTTSYFIDHGWIGTYREVTSNLGLKEGVEVYVEPSPPPSSIQHIREKLRGRSLDRNAIYEIVYDVVHGNLSEVEITAFVASLHMYGLSLEEAAAMSEAMVATGERLELEKKPVLDKHSIGGVPGDKTTLIVVPIVASLGYTIPKTSSRAITSAAGTADRAEAIMPVSLSISEMKEVVERTGGCIVWGGALHLAPADDIFVNIERPLQIDPLLLPSIMAKKKAVGAEHLVIDIPTGRGTKVKTIGEANLLAKDFIRLSDLLGIKAKCCITYGEQPVGFTVGPALEAREALELLSLSKDVPDLLDKACNIAGMLLESVGEKDGYNTALAAVKRGTALSKLREIVEAQGGDPAIKPEDVAVGECRYTFRSTRSGIVLWIDNNRLVEVARSLGAPKDKGAGVELHKKVGDAVKPGDPLFTLYAEKEYKLDYTMDKIEEEGTFIGVGGYMDMLIQKVEEIPVYSRAFILER